MQAESGAPAPSFDDPFYGGRMRTALDELQTETTGTASFTARSVLLGSFMCFAIGVLGPYWVFFLKSSYLFIDYSVGGQIFLLFVVLLIFNVALRKLWGRFALRPGEMVVVAAMMLAGGAVTTMGLVGYLVPNLTAPYYFASPANQWDTELLPHLPEQLFPMDPGGGTTAIEQFYTGLKEGEAVPWGPWIKPLLRWAVFLAALYTCMTSMMAIMRKQWVDHERLSFPVAQISQELCTCAARPWGPASILRKPLFWFGFGVPFFVGSLVALSRYFPGVPTITTSYFWMAGKIQISFYLSFAVLGFTFLIPNRNRVASTMRINGTVNRMYLSILLLNITAPSPVQTLLFRELLSKLHAKSGTYPNHAIICCFYLQY